MNLIGWIGSILLALCGLPIAFEAFKNKKSDINWMFLLMWGMGEIFTLIYVSSKSDVLPLMFNYGLNILFLSIVLFYKLRK